MCAPHGRKCEPPVRNLFNKIKGFDEKPGILLSFYSYRECSGCTRSGMKKLGYETGLARREAYRKNQI